MKMAHLNTLRSTSAGRAAGRLTVVASHEAMVELYILWKHHLKLAEIIDGL